ncbi:MAG: NADH-quinone oxidoreductase subunit C [Candidatus Scalinduaceae bacterium]
MTEENIIEKNLREKFPESILDVETFRDELTINIEKNFIEKVARYLRDDDELSFDFLSDLCGVDKTRLGDNNTFEVVYHLYSLKRNHRVRIKVQIPVSNPTINTVTNVWNTANWHEREAYDMFGIIFKGHPNLERILTPDGFEGHPLRKDYPLKGRQPESLRETYRKGE